MQKRFKVVWICHFTNIEIQTKLPLWKKFNEFGSWIINAIAGFEKHDDIELHIVAPHIYLKRDTHFILRGINYHFLSFGFPIINRPWPSFFALDAICFYPFLTRKIQKTVKRINPDIINLQGAENAYYSQSILKLKNEFPCVITIQGFACHLYDKKSRINKTRISIEEKILRNFKFYFFDNDAENVIKKYSPNFTGKIIWWPASEKLIDSIPDVDYHAKSYDILYCGRMEKSKGIEDFIKVVSLIKQKNSDIKAAIIGDCQSTYFKYLEELGNNLSCWENIHFIGFVETQSMMFNYFKASKLFLVPTLVDRYPSTIREAMRIKIPVVAYRTGSIPWTNNNGENIVLVDHGSISQMAAAVEVLLGDSEQQKKLSQAAWQFYEDEFSCDKNTDRFISGYKEVTQDFNDCKLTRQ